MALKINIDELPNLEVVESGNLRNQDPNTLSTKLVYGTETAFRYAGRAPGYHSKPHVHDCEQLNYVLEGELSIYMEGMEYRIGPGDFMNVPANAVHWAWNRGETNCVMIESHTPVHAPRNAYGLFDDGEEVGQIAWSPTIWLSDKYAEGEEDFPLAPENSPWVARSASVRPSQHSQMASAGKLESLFVYGETTNLMVATRAGRYHSKPHIHDCEQLNLLLKGQLWIFLEDRGYLLRPGDFFRVPRLRSHWAWNDEETDCLLVEVHSPVLDPAAKENAVPLFPKERMPFLKTVRNLFLPEHLAENEPAMMALESRV